MAEDKNVSLGKAVRPAGFWATTITIATILTDIIELVVSGNDRIDFTLKNTGDTNAIDQFTLLVKTHVDSEWTTQISNWGASGVGILLMTDDPSTCAISDGTARAVVYLGQPYAVKLQAACAAATTTVDLYGTFGR